MAINHYILIEIILGLFILVLPNIWDGLKKKREWLYCVARAIFFLCVIVVFPYISYEHQVAVGKNEMKDKNEQDSNYHALYVLLEQTRDSLRKYRPITNNNTTMHIMNNYTTQPKTDNVWISETQERFSDGNLLTTFYQDFLLPDSMRADGSYYTGDYTITPANNGNTKTAFVKFNWIPLITYSIPPNSEANIYLKVMIKMINKMTKRAYYESVVSMSGAQDIRSSGYITIDFNKKCQLILQGKGVKYGDIKAIQGSGIIYPVPPFIP